MIHEKKLSVFFLGPANATSTLHRCRMVSRELESRGYESKLFPLLHIFSGKVPNLLSHIDCWRKIVQLHPDFLVLHRNSNLFDLAMIKKVKNSHHRTKIIFDYDDALFPVRLPGRIISYSHLNQILSISDGVTAGSHYLKEFALKLNKNVTLMPTPVDMKLFDPGTRRVGDSSTITIGRLGAGIRSQLRYLRT